MFTDCGKIWTVGCGIQDGQWGYAIQFVRFYVWNAGIRF